MIILLLHILADPPEVTQHPKHQSAFIGADINFTVEATGDDLQFQWQKDGKDIDSSESRFQCIQKDKTSTLNIQCVKKSDKGCYKCLVKNPVEERGEPSYVAELTVRKYCTVMLTEVFDCRNSHFLSKFNMIMY